MSKAFAHKFKEAYLYTTREVERGSDELVGLFYTIMFLQTSKDGELSTYIDKNSDNDNNDTSLREILIDNHTTQANTAKKNRPTTIKTQFWILLRV